MCCCLFSANDHYYLSLVAGEIVCRKCVYAPYCLACSAIHCPIIVFKSAVTECAGDLCIPESYYYYMETIFCTELYANVSICPDVPKIQDDWISKVNGPNVFRTCFCLINDYNIGSCLGACEIITRKCLYPAYFCVCWPILFPPMKLCEWFITLLDDKKESCTSNCCFLLPFYFFTYGLYCWCIYGGGDDLEGGRDTLSKQMFPAAVPDFVVRLRTDQKKEYKYRFMHALNSLSSNNQITSHAHYGCSSDFEALSKNDKFNYVKHMVSVGLVDINDQFMIHGDNGLGDTTKYTVCSGFVLAAITGNVDIARLFVDKGCDIDECSSFKKNYYMDLFTGGRSALWYACHQGHSAFVEYLISKGCSVNTTLNYHFILMTALCAACSKGNLEIIKILVESGAEINPNLEHGRRDPLTEAISSECCDEKVVKYLIEMGADINKCGSNVCIHAIDKGYIWLVDLLVGKGFDINNTVQNDIPLLFKLCQSSNVAMIHYVLDKGMDVNIQNKNKTNALMVVCERGDLATAKVLVDRGIAIEHTDYNNSSALWYAAQSGDVNLTDYLIGLGVDINKPNRSGETAAIRACMMKHVNLVTFLLAKGCDVNHQDTSHGSLFLYACKNKLLDLAKELIDHGPVTTMRDGNSKTGMDYLDEAQRKEIETYLSTKQAFNMRKSKLQGIEHIKQLGWSEVQFVGVIGRGSYSVVVKCKYGLEIVAIKVLTLNTTSQANSYDKLCAEAIEEASLMVETERELVASESIVRVLGVCSGQLPSNVPQMFGLPRGSEAVGIMMRYEGGGSLDLLLHPPATEAKRSLRTDEKIHILMCVARGITELHSINLVHGDVKPGNILLSHHNPPLVRLADFGQAEKRDNSAIDTLGNSILSQTSTRKGTPVYAAPELLPSVHDSSSDEEADDKGEVSSMVNRIGRRSDMYAFGVLCWEVLNKSGNKPFHDIGVNEMKLIIKVHKGKRPPLSDLIDDLPPSVKLLIESCWDGDRSKRLSALDCYTILEQVYNVLMKSKFDIFFSHPWINKNVLQHVKYYLAGRGYRVWYDVNEMGWDLVKSMQDGISNSKVVLVCLNKAYEKSKNCMFELIESKKLNKTLVVLVTEPEPFSWAGKNKQHGDVMDLCALSSKMFVDIGTLSCRPEWPKECEDVPVPPELLIELKKNVEVLIKTLQDPAVACMPSHATPDKSL